MKASFILYVGSSLMKISGYISCFIFLFLVEYLIVSSFLVGLGLLDGRALLFIGFSVLHTVCAPVGYVGNTLLIS